MTTRQDALKYSSREQFTSFRVFVYRLHIPGTVSIPGISRDRKLDDILRTDFGDTLYHLLSENLNTPTTGTNQDKNAFNNFLYRVNSLIKSAVSEKTITQLASGADPVFREIDITPLVRSVDTSLVIDGINQATIHLADPYLNSFSIDEYNRYLSNIKQSPFLLLNQMVNRGFVNVNTVVEELRGFQFSEFDLVRVYAYSKYDAPPISDATNMELRLTSQTPSYATGTGTRFYMRPAFTGLVTTISKSNEAGASAEISAGCLGIQRMLSQSVTVSSQALSNIVARATPELNTLSSDMNVLANRFNDMNGDQIMLTLFDEYFYTADLKAMQADSKVALCVPSLKNLLSKMFVTSGTSASSTTPVLIPMLPAVILLHMLKMKYREPILSFDDRMEGLSDFVDDSTSTDFSLVVPRGTMHDALNPFLIRSRDSFATFDANYMSASDLFGVIRENTFMEVFEDRTGQFHYRFPRYNLAVTTHDIPISDNIRVENVRDDSANFSCFVAQRPLPFESNSGLPGAVFIDKFSVFRYGFRKPQTAENPNSTDEDFARALSKFMRDYGSGRLSRRADVSLTGDITINLGEMVIFRQGRQGKLSGPGEDTQSSGERAEDTYVGYVIGINESISVDGKYGQVLHLGFVRNARLMGSEPTLSDYSIRGTLWDATAVNFDTVEHNYSSVEDDPDSSLSAESYLNFISIRPKSVAKASFRYVADPFELAKVASTAKSYKESRDITNFGKRTKKKNDPKEISVLIRGNSNFINLAKRKIAVMQRLSKILKGFAASVRNDVAPIFVNSPTVSSANAFSLGVYNAMVKQIGRYTSPNESISFQDANGQEQSDSVSISDRGIFAPALTVNSLISEVSKEARDQGLSDNFSADWSRMFGLRAPSGSGGNALEQKDKTLGKSLIKILTDTADFFAEQLGNPASEQQALTDLFKKRKELDDAGLAAANELKAKTSSNKKVPSQSSPLTTLSEEESAFNVSDQKSVAKENTPE